MLLRLISWVARGWLRAHGVRLGKFGWVFGLPQLRLTRGSSVEIGNGVSLCSWSRFNPLAPLGRVRFVTNTPAARIVIGDDVGISSSVISCSTRIAIGNETLIGAECLITDSDFHGLPLGQKKPVCSAPVVIGSRVFIGTRSIVLKGVTIGDGAVIGAGSVVTRDIPAHTLAAGNPARVVRPLGADSMNKPATA